MARRVIAAALFLILALAMPSVCYELCVDDDVFACAHTLTAILDEVRVVAPPVTMLHLVSQQHAPSSSAFPADIFHVPLLG